MQTSSRIALALSTFMVAALLACTKTPAPTLESQTCEIAPPAYVLDHTEVRDITSQSLGRSYQIFVSLPLSYEQRTGHRFLIVFVTDAIYAFPLVRSIARRVGQRGAGVEDFILIGLSYAKDETSQHSRNRDYTPTPNGESKINDITNHDGVYGQAEAYRRHIANEVFPFIAAHYRVDMNRKIFAGHSYGGLLGAHILLTEPTMFERYILTSPSLWFDNKVTLTREQKYAATHTDLHAEVFLAIGAYETINPLSSNKRYHQTHDMVRDLQRFSAQLQSRRYPNLKVLSTVIAEEDHLTVYPSAITRGLAWALPPTSNTLIE